MEWFSLERRKMILGKVGKRSLRVFSAALVAALVVSGAWFSPLGAPFGAAGSVAYAAVMGDDYPAKWKALPLDAAVDDWGMYTRECTSFVAWRLFSANGYAFNRAGKSWNANRWGGNAAALGVTVDMNPTIGSVAWWDAGFHVAWVAEVNGDKVTIEEYNCPSNSGKYNCRTIAKASVSGYIHFKDIGAATPQTPGAGFDGQAGTGGYADTDSQAQPVIEKLQRPTKIKLTAGERSLKVRWTKPSKAAAQQITGYQIKYRASQGTAWGKWKTKTYKLNCNAKGKTARRALKKLVTGKIYQIKLRAYKAADAGTEEKPRYSAWTKAKKSERIG
jgi:surface antigen